VRFLYSEGFGLVCTHSTCSIKVLCSSILLVGKIHEKGSETKIAGQFQFLLGAAYTYTTFIAHM